MPDPEFTQSSKALKYWIENKGVTAYQLAKETLLTQSKISEILSNKRRITTETATILGAYFGNGADYWLSVQLQNDLLSVDIDRSLGYDSAGEVRIGKYILRCYVLPDESRVVSAANFFMFFGINSARVGPSRLASILDNPYLKSDKNTALRRKLVNPLKVGDGRGGIVLCYEGELIVDFCQALLDLRRLKDAMPQWALPYADEAEIIITSVAKVGIVALIDEATGFQARRNRTPVPLTTSCTI